MMANNILGELRRSHIILNGPGSIIDFRAGAKGGGPVSIISGSLESWDSTAKINNFLTDPHKIYEERLQKKLRKSYFRLPPVDVIDIKEGEYKKHLTGARFPQWLQCPKCHHLKMAKKWNKEIGDPSRWCGKCSKGDLRVHVVPTRFVSACEKGHLSEFPWIWFLKTYSNTPACGDEKPCQLTLKSYGGLGLSSLILKCVKCKASASMKNVFARNNNSSPNMKCSGFRPWIGDYEECKEDLRFIQRGAANIYFSKTESALSIPPWDDKFQESIADIWEPYLEADENTRNVLVNTFADQRGYTVEEFRKEINKRIELINNQENEDLRKDEYLKFIDKNIDNSNSESEFKIVHQTIPNDLEPFIESLVKVERLKEVRVQVGFSRINAPIISDNDENSNVAKLSKNELKWLPACEIRGEGIFLQLNKNKIKDWLNENPLVNQRIEGIIAALLEEEKKGIKRSEVEITPTFMLIHTLSHALIRQLCLHSGYSAASIKERIYTGNNSPEMTGLLLYTGTSDSDGTLGGLARQAEPDLFSVLFKGAINQANWCASDPLCMDGISTISESYNLAACHSCMLSPETSCEHFNKFLDRALLIGLPDNKNIGFFSKLYGVDFD